MVARITRPHGLAGELILHLDTGRPEDVFTAGRVLGVVPKPEGLPAALTTVRGRSHGRGWRLAVEEITDRTLAERYAGREVTVSRDELPGLAKDEYFLHELTGMTVVDERGEALGKVGTVYEMPGQVMLGVAVDGKELLIPFRREMVDSVDTEAKVIAVRLPDGLLDV